MAEMEEPKPEETEEKEEVVEESNELPSLLEAAELTDEELSDDFIKEAVNI